MLKKKFTHINQSFTCEYCQTTIPPLEKGCRNHCPFCLSSKHVDLFPGDRSVECLGKMSAISYHLNPKKGVVINFKCQKCHLVKNNKAAIEDTLQADDFDKILQLQADRTH
jgi:hypothetical protein|tara:strand:+ start:55 stop:387 length:333 start_codon:yes stop_codon:yes gene_type:complete